LGALCCANAVPAHSDPASIPINTHCFFIARYS
jgi:hypothetical protein